MIPNINLNGKTILVTGAADFIGANLVMELLRTVHPVHIVGLDNMNDYYDPALKEYRLGKIEALAAGNPESRWSFRKGSIADRDLLDALFDEYRFDIVVNLAAQAGCDIPLPKTVKEVFDRYTNPEEGFTHTSVPIAHMFTGGSPVSRSEARRLGGMLLRFKKATLDFTGVTGIGQAFTHELFVVWQRRNPEIELNCIGMAEDVERMIRRVLVDAEKVN